MTTAFNVFASKAGREYRIPFEVSADRSAERGNPALEAIQEVKRMKAHFAEQDLIPMSIR